MRSIHKGKEPAAWVEFRSTPGSSYNDVNAPKEPLRHALVAEQRGLCCYCLGRIEASPSKMKIEHWACQARYPARRLEYRNLLGACRGNEDRQPRMRHCDATKGAKDISVNPAEPLRDCSSLFTYWLTGEIRAAEDDPDVTQDIATLALNHPRIKAGRRERILQVVHEVKRGKARLTSAKLMSMAAKLEEPDEKGELRPFCQAAIFWLRRQATKR